MIALGKSYRIMQAENITTTNSKNPIRWKKLENNISVGHFLSTNPAPGYNPSQVYVKKYAALKNDSEKQMTIFLLHDIGQYHGRFNSFIKWSREHYPNITFIAMDFVGHGLSSGTRGHFEKFEYLVNDFHYLLTQLEKNDNKKNEKWIVAGHGMGGLVALDLLNRFQDSVEHRIDGLVLSNFILKFPSLFLQLEEQFIEKTVFKKLISHSRPLRVFKGEEVLSHPEDILSYDQDPLVVHRPTLNSVREVQKKMTNIYQESYFLGKPLMLMKSSSGSPISSNGIDYFAKGIKKDLLTEKKYSLMKHDLYNEREKESAFQDIMNWMKIYET